MGSIIFYCLGYRSVNCSLQDNPVACSGVISLVRELRRLLSGCVTTTKMASLVNKP